MEHIRVPTGEPVPIKLSTMKHLKGLIWSPRKSPVLIKHSGGADLLRKLFREGTCQVVEVDRHALSLKALMLTLLNLRTDLKLTEQYLGHYAKLTNCVVVVTFKNNGEGLHAFKSQKSSIVTVSFQNGLYSSEDNKPDWSRRGASGPDLAFGFGVEHLRWFFYPMVHQPVAYPTGSLRSNLVPIARGQSPRRPLLFVSTWRPNARPAVLKLVSQFLPSLSTWCADHKIDLVVLGASKTEQEREKSFFEDYLKPGTFRFTPKSGSDWTEAYRQVDSAEIVVTMNSTLGVEAILRGKKTCFVTNLPQDKADPDMRIFSPLVLETEHGPFWINNGSVEELSRLLTRLYLLSEEEYAELLGDSSWLGVPDPGLFQTRKNLVEECPQLEDVVKPLPQPVSV